jgi:hypothetical protein
VAPAAAAPTAPHRAALARRIIAGFRRSDARQLFGLRQ